MASIKDTIMKDFEGIVEEDKEIYYDAALNYKGDAPEGTYPGHISNLNVKENVEIKRSKSVADILEVFVTIADDARELDFPTEDGKKESGALFVGRDYKSRGIFKFKSPPEHLVNKGYSTNPGGNSGYRDFCSNIGLELEVVEERDSGQHLYKLPDITVDTIRGLPVLATLSKRMWKDSKGEQILSEKSGKPMYSMEVVSILPWENGEQKDFGMDDVPF